MLVDIHGLRNQVQYNGRRGEVTAILDDGRIAVRLSNPHTAIRLDRMHVREVQEVGTCALRQMFTIQSDFVCVYFFDFVT
jgi:hypothetical protein